MHYSLLLTVALAVSQVRAEYAPVKGKSYPFCKHCDYPYYDNGEKVYGRIDGDWCEVNLTKCIDSVKSIHQTIAPTTTKFSKPTATPFWKKEGKLPCNHCNVSFVDKDKGPIGIMNNSWCGIDETFCSQSIKGYWSENEGIPPCDNCEVLITDARGEYGIMNDNWCGIDSKFCNQFKGESTSGDDINGYKICHHCDAVFTDSEGIFGIENDNWCAIDLDRCAKYIKMTTTKPVHVPKTTTLATTSTTLGHPICKKCEIVYTDDNNYGVEDNEWCIIDMDRCAKYITTTTTTSSTPFGYPVCKKCEIVFTDNEGSFGVENEDWCVIDTNRCAKYITTTTTKTKSGKTKSATTTATQTSVPVCDHCNIYFYDSSVYFGDMGGDEGLCIIDKNRCAKYISEFATKTVNVPKVTTIAATSTSSFWSESLGYPRCNSCEVYYYDEKKQRQFGVENDEWCGIDEEYCSKNKPSPKPVFWSVKLGYPKCDHCTVSYVDDKKRQWGIMDGDWCGISDDCRLKH